VPNDACYYAGLVSWAPEELRAEVELGAWYVMDAESEAVFRKDKSGLWEEFVRLARSLRADLREERKPRS
jgi:putative AlgH/UPF0301 family transcriptional regulator